MPFKPDTEATSRFKPDTEDVGEPTFGQKAGALGYGTLTGLVGGLGELEKFGAYDVPEMVGLREKGERDQFLGRETIFPTIAETEQVLKKVGISKPSEEVGGYKTAGEVLGGLGPALPGLAKALQGL